MFIGHTQLAPTIRAGTYAEHFWYVEQKGKLFWAVHGIFNFQTLQPAPYGTQQTQTGFNGSCWGCTLHLSRGHEQTQSDTLVVQNTVNHTGVSSSLFYFGSVLFLKLAGKWVKKPLGPSFIISSGATANTQRNKTWGPRSICFFFSFNKELKRWGTEGKFL